MVCCNQVKDYSRKVTTMNAQSIKQDVVQKYIEWLSDVELVGFYLDEIENAEVLTPVEIQKIGDYIYSDCVRFLPILAQYDAIR